MHSLSSVARMAGVVLAVLMVPAGAGAQLVSVKTVPVAAGDQFSIFPSHNLGMGGVSIALDDPWLDPFVNPAKGSRLQGARVFATPTVYTISQQGGSARTLPTGVLFGSDRWFGGFTAALQQLSGSEPPPFVVFEAGSGFGGNLLSDQSASNMYGFGMIGRTLPGGKVSIAGSALLADLSAMEGVDLLYALSERVDQSGDLMDFRLGVTAELSGGRSLEALVLHNRLDMRHDVTYLDWVFADPIVPPGTLQRRVETNLDRTNTWGVHVGYVQPIGPEGWRVGGILTGNYKSHPKIPNYEIMNIPRDPGNSRAYDIGVGLAKADGPTTFGVDVIYEPIWSDTWAEAEEPVITSGGLVIPAGGRTVDNDFRFSNAEVRMGVTREVKVASLQLGLGIRSVDYELRQRDHVQERDRRQHEHWMEWSPSWGARVILPDLEIRYQGRVTTGTGRPGVAWVGGAAERLDAAAAGDIVVAPGGPLTLQDAAVTTHQLMIALPIPN